MSVSRGMGQNGGHFYSNITQPVKIDLNFIVDSANGNGLGIRSLKSNGYVRNVFMHTSASAGSNDGYLNPNPASGYALIQFNNNFNYYLGGFTGFVSPTTGGASGSTTNHNAYIIASVGTTTTAQWVAKGVPVGLTPVAGLSFIATATGALGGTGTVIAAGASGIASVEVVGDPNKSISNSSLAVNGGAWLMVQFLKASTSAVTSTLTMNSYTPAGSISAGVVAVATGTAGDAVTNNAGVLNSVGGQDLAVNAQTFTGTPSVLTGTIANAGGATTFAAGAPADESVVGMSAFFDLSSVTIDGL